MRGFDHATILSSSFHGQCKERLAQWPPNWVGVCGTLPETLTLFQTKICDFPYPISDLIKNLIPYFRPEALEPCAWPERVTSCYGTCTVDVNIKREMVLSPNDEVASSKNIPNSRLECTNHTLFQTKMVTVSLAWLMMYEISNGSLQVQESWIYDDLLVVFYPIIEVLLMKILPFFHIWWMHFFQSYQRFQTTELVERPIPKTLDIF